ncbi:MAG TPA: hypothetical protein DCZ03_02295 [Gammaproteobacteria bacterium]|nr:hypothetical protein [Gammaproteobacteria bacterium]
MNWLQYLNHRIFDVDYVLVDYAAGVHVMQVKRQGSVQYVAPKKYEFGVPIAGYMYIKPKGELCHSATVSIAKRWYPLTKRMAEVYRGEPF